MEKQYKTPEERKAQRLKLAQRQRAIRAGAILLAIVLSLISLVQSCSTKKAIEDLAAQIAAKKAAQAEALQAEASVVEIPVIPETVEAVPGDHTITLSFVGDVTLCGPEDSEAQTRFQSTLENQGAACFFEDVKSIFEGDDLTVINLECVLANTGRRVEKSTTFRADPSYMDILTEGGVDAVSIASDHTRDYGDEGHVDTIAGLDNADLYRFGNGFTTMVTLDGIQVGFCGVDETEHGIGSQEELETDIYKLKEAGAEIIIVSIHWGEENATTPGDFQVELGHAAVDAGADLVIGHHPRVLQGIELYKGKYICYSLGTFLTGDTGLTDMDTVIFQQTFTLKDKTLESDFQLIPCVRDGDSFATLPASGTAAQTVLDKIYERSAQLDGGIQREEA